MNTSINRFAYEVTFRHSRKYQKVGQCFDPWQPITAPNGTYDSDDFGSCLAHQTYRITDRATRCDDILN
jgi:hypothetical protein